MVSVNRMPMVCVLDDERSLISSPPAQEGRRRLGEAAALSQVL
jgi:hypothetical protein